MSRKTNNNADRKRAFGFGQNFTNNTPKSNNSNTGGAYYDGTVIGSGGTQTNYSFGGSSASLGRMSFSHFDNNMERNDGIPR